MAERLIGGFRVWASATKVGDEPALAYVEVKKSDDSDECRIFQVITTCRFETLEAAQSAANAVVNAIHHISSTGVPDSLAFQGHNSQ